MTFITTKFRCHMCEIGTRGSTSSVSCGTTRRSPLAAAARIDFNFRFRDRLSRSKSKYKWNFEKFVLRQRGRCVLVYLFTLPHQQIAHIVAITFLKYQRKMGHVPSLLTPSYGKRNVLEFKAEFNFIALIYESVR